MNNTEINKYPDELITGYLNDDLDEAQQKELESWVSKDPTHKKYFYEMVEVWLTVAAEKKSLGNKGVAYQRFKERVGKKKAPKRVALSAMQMAASLLIGVLLLGGSFYLGKNKSQKLFAFNVQTIEVPLGSRSKIVLSDGTIVWLNAGSKLSYPAEFTDKERRVNLKGEGYFEVAHNKNIPFVVSADDVAIKVLGTRFNMRAYKDEDYIEVILAEGSVQFVNNKHPSSSFVMKPEQQAIYNKEDGSINVKQVETSQANDWISGAHFFNELTFKQITGQLEKTFNVSFIFRSENKKELIFYGDFRSDDSLDDILEIMARGKKFNYKKTSNLIEIY